MVAIGTPVLIPKWKKAGDRVGRQCAVITGPGYWENWYRAMTKKGDVYQVRRDVIYTQEEVEA